MVSDPNENDEIDYLIERTRKIRQEPESYERYTRLQKYYMAINDLIENRERIEKAKLFQEEYERGWKELEKKGIFYQPSVKKKKFYTYQELIDKMEKNKC